MLSLVRPVAMALLAMASWSSAAARPNVVLILTEEQGYGDLTSSGNPYLRTPHLDRLRAASTEFSRCIAAPGGVATRAELLTGRHEFRCGISHSLAGRNLIRAEVPVLPELLRAAGYRTAIIGKWALGDALPCRPEDRGFEDVFVHGGGGIGQTPDHWGNSFVDPWMRRNTGWVATKGYCTQVCLDEAQRWLTARAADQQAFFLLLALNAPQAPYEAPAGTAARMIERTALREPAASNYAMIEDLDARVGDLLAALERLQLESNTIMVFLGASGSAIGTWNAGMRGVKGSPDDGGVRVPAFIRWPQKIAAKRMVDALASPLDILPTLAQLCAVPLPENWSGDGGDLAPAMFGKTDFTRDRMLFSHVGHWPGDDPPERHRAQGFAVRDDRWLLSGLDLFDMSADPGQGTNVFEQHAAVATRLLGAYGIWWNSVRETLREPVRYIIGDPRQPTVNLSACDWWPSREVDGAAGAARLSTQAAIRRTLLALSQGAAVAESSGLWKLRAASAGHYQVKLALLPTAASEAERAQIGQLKAGRAHLRCGKRELQMDLRAGTPAVTLSLDLAAGDVDMEAWFSGQLPEGRRLGAWFAEIQRTGARKRPEIDLEFRTIPKN